MIDHSHTRTAPHALTADSPDGRHTVSHWRCLRGLCGRDLRLLARSPAQSLYGFQMFILICLLLPMSVSPDPALLREIGGGLIWTACLLSSLLGVNSQLRQDLSGGGSQVLLCSPCPLELLVLAKWGVNWLVVCAPVVLAAPAVAWTYGFEPRALLWLAVALLLTTPVVCALSMLAVIFSAGVRGGDLLAAVIALPLFLPVAVAGSDAVAHAQWGREISGHLLFMAGVLLICLCLMPWAAASALRLGAYKQ